MQKGHVQSSAPILLILLIALLVASLATSGAFAKSVDVGPLIPINGLRSADPAARPIFGRVLPTPPIYLQSQPTTKQINTKQGSGPDPDDNLTALATTSFELQPNASPGSTQNRIVFSSNGSDTDGDGQIDSVVATDDDYDLWIMKSDGGDQYELVDLPGDQVDPCYDPGGRMIVFSQRINNIWQICTLEVRDPAVIKQITTGPGNKRHPTWSPDFNWIGFQDDVNGNWDIYKILATGQGQPVAVTTGPTDDTDPAWSPAGAQIAFTRSTSGLKRICLVDSAGTTIDVISDGGGSPTANDEEPAWRQNGAELAFVSSRLTEVGDSNPDRNVWRMTTVGETNGAIPILVSNTSVSDTKDDTDPTWTVDIDRAPTRISFVSKRANGQPDIWAMQMSDWIAPILKSVPTATPRVCTPGEDVTVSVPVYDKDSGVRQVIASFKNPDIKSYVITSGEHFDTNFSDGVRYLEWDCAAVGQVELLDEDGDGVFSGTWTTQAISSGRDYIIDITVVDIAGNAQTYDDVYGFSTKTFSPRHNVLFVDDYCEGQLFLAQLGWTNNFGAAWPVESYYTYNPSYYPGVESTIDYDTISDAYGDEYDVWRVICRGPIPAAVYQYYLPTVEYQLDPTKLDDEGSVGVTADRAVAVAERAIVWAAPHTGDVWIADGSIMDASTQADVASFVRRGGRLFMAGEDIAWALTLNGTRTNTFLTTTLRARFVADCAIQYFDIYYNYFGRSWRMQQTSAEFGVQGLAGDEVTTDPWTTGPYRHYSDLGYTGWWLDPTDNPNVINTSRFILPDSGPWYNDAAQFSVRPDAIEPLDAVKLYGLATSNGTSSYGGPAVGLRYEDASRENGGRVVYLSMGFEQLNRGYHAPGNNTPDHCRNVRSHLMHNALCWMRTGGFQGRVVSISDGGQALTDPAPIVTATQRDNAGNIAHQFAVRCQKDGTYIMQGLPPGQYQLQAYRPGYEIDHYEAEYVHGGQTPRTVDFDIKRAQPGAVTGTVTTATDGKPLANVSVSVAQDPAVPDQAPVSLPDPVISAADGTYTLPYIPAGSYIITADGRQILYEVDDQPATVTAGDTTTVDFALAAADGTVVATVNDVDEPTTLIRNAAVAITDSGGSRTTSYTDDSGTVSVDLAPGSYTAVISAPGYQASAAQSFSIEPAATYPLKVSLKKQPGGAILGRVTAAGSGSFVGGVTIRVFFGSEEITSTTTASSALSLSGVTGQYNYQIEDVPTGEVTVVAERSGFTASPTSRTVVIESGVTADDINFSMQSLHTFPVGLQLVSMPWDYSSVDPATLLGVGSSSWGMATWEAVRQRYRLYPNAPADRFRLGTGYWMKLNSAADLTQQGIDAEDPVEIPLSAGWNLVGCPYNKRIDFYTVSVRDSSNVEYSLQQALSQGIIGSGLYAYVLSGYQSVGVLSPYTGYWLKTYEPCTLIVSAKVGALSLTETRDATPQAKDGWLLQLTTTAAGAQDGATFIGAARTATAGCDFGLDQQKPPVPAMGKYLYTAIDNRDWAKAAGDYAVDVRAEGATAWNLKVYTNLTGQKINLSWGDMSGLPNDVRPLLVDVESGKQVYMRTCSAYTFTATKAAHRLKVVIDAAAVGALAITPQGVMPTAAGTTISYTLSQAADVDVTITNIAGRPVRQVLTAQAQTAGQNSVLWDGRDQGGRKVPGGRYLVTVTGRTASGQQARSIMPLQQVTK